MSATPSHRQLAVTPVVVHAKEQPAAVAPEKPAVDSAPENQKKKAKE